MLKGTWGIVDSKLDMGFHCVRPTEIGNAILHCIFYSPLEQLGGESLSLAKNKSARPTHACLKNSLAEVKAEAGASFLPQDSYPTEVVAFSFLLASPPPWVLRDQLSVLSSTLLMCFLGIAKGGQSCMGSPSGLQVRLAFRRSFVCNSNICHVP